MSRGRSGWVFAATLAGVLLARSAPAQTVDLVGRGVRAYENVELAAAATLLRRALAESLSTADEVRALTYLGATEVFAGSRRRDVAVSVFRRLLLVDPRQRPDPLVFPPQVLRVFEETRHSTKAVLVTIPADTGFTPGVADEAFVAALYATSFHEIEVRVAREDGSLVRTLYAGSVGDSLQVRWDGLDMEGAQIASGRYVLSVASRASPAGRIVRLVQVPLHAELVAPDTLAPLLPMPDSLLRSERSSVGIGFASLAAGLLAGGAVLALPSVIADGTKPSQARFVVAGAVSIAGIVGLVTQPGRVRRRNIAANQAVRAEWQRRREERMAENARRRAAVRLTVRAGKPTVVDVVGAGT